MCFPQRKFYFSITVSLFRKQQANKNRATRLYLLMIWWGFSLELLSSSCVSKQWLSSTVFRSLVFKADLWSATSACLLVGGQRCFGSVLSVMGLSQCRAPCAMAENTMLCSEFPVKCLQLKPCLTFAKTLKKSCLALTATTCLYFLSSTLHSNLKKKRSAFESRNDRHEHPNSLKSMEKLPLTPAVRLLHQKRGDN